MRGCKHSLADTVLYTEKKDVVVVYTYIAMLMCRVGIAINCRQRNNFFVNSIILIIIYIYIISNIVIEFTKE